MRLKQTVKETAGIFEFERGEKMTTQRQRKHKFCLPPCPSYDVEGMESWLTDMAKKGFLLCRDGFFAGIASFEKSDPCSIRYRLEAAPKGTSIWSDNGGEPDAEAVMISEAYGWEYVAARGDFYIYRSREAGTRELNTDPQVQALAIRAVHKRERSSVITCFFWGVLYPILFLQGSWLLSMMDSGTWFVLFGIVLFIWIFAETLVHAIHLGRLRKKLLSEGTINHHKNWKKKSICYYMEKLLFVVLVLIWFGILLHQWSCSVMDEDKVALADYSGTPPFATMEDFVSEDSYLMNDFGVSNTIEEKTDWLAPVIIHWKETASGYLSEEEHLSGGLYVDYYETISPWLAKEAAREYWHKAKRSKGYEALSLPQLDVDYAVAYMNSIHIPTIIIQDGTKIMRASFYQTSPDYNMNFEEWVKMMADSI